MIHTRSEVTTDELSKYGDPQHDAAPVSDPEEATRRRYGAAQHEGDTPTVVGPSDLRRVRTHGQ